VQYASFQDRYHLYFLFDLMTGGDLMDVLVAEAKVIKQRVPKGQFKRGCLAPKTKMLKVRPLQKLKRKKGPLLPLSRLTVNCA
jgi:hypothetical protein